MPAVKTPHGPMDVTGAKFTGYFVPVFKCSDPECGHINWNRSTGPSEQFSVWVACAREGEYTYDLSPFRGRVGKIEVVMEKDEEFITVAFVRHHG